MAFGRPQSLADLPSHWRAFDALRRRLAAGIGEAYDRLGIEGVNPRFSMAVMFLDEEPLTIRTLAERCGVTHSAMSQSVAAMRAAGLVVTRPGSDARSRVVELTGRGRQVAPVLRAEWDATEAAIAELERQTGAAIAEYVRATTAALEREPFVDRVLRHLRR